MKLIVLLLLFFTFERASSQNNFEADFTHLAGTLNKVLFVNEQLVFCIGANGILLQSNDSGESWNKVKLTTHSKLVDIKYKDNHLVIISSDGLIINSTDFGKTWKYQRLFEKELISLFLDKVNHWLIVSTNELYITSNQGKDWQVKALPNNKVTQISSNNNLIVATDSQGQVFFSDNNGTSWKSNEQLNQYCPNCFVNQIKWNNNILEILFGFNKKLAISSDNVSTFDVKDLQYIYTDYFYHNDEFYGVKSELLKDEIIEIYQENLNSKKASLVSTFAKDYYIDYPYNLIKSFSIFENNCIAVGWNKTIIKSSDLGKNWKLISNLDAGRNKSTFNQITKNKNYLFAAASNANLFISSNQGATWLPQKNQNLDRTRDISYVIIDDEDNGYFYSYDITSTKSFPIGKINIRENNFSFLQGKLSFQGISNSIFKKEQDLFYIERQSNTNSKYYISCFDDKAKELKLISLDSIKIEELSIKDSLNIRGWGIDFANTLNKPIYFSTYDGGKTWNKKLIAENDSMQDIQFICTDKKTQRMYLGLNNTTLDTNTLDIYKENVYVSDDDGNNWQVFSSEIPHKSRNIKYVFENNNELFAIGTTELYILNKVNSKWEVLYNYYDKGFFVQSVKNYNIFSDASTNDVYILLANYNKQPSIIMLNTNSDTTSIEIQDPLARPLLYSSAPYPIPAQNYVKSTIYWNSVYDINQAKFSVTDVFGTTIPFHNINIEQTDTYKGILNWDCTGISSGIYFIRVQLGSETITVPVAVGK